MACGGNMCAPMSARCRQFDGNELLLGPDTTIEIPFTQVPKNRFSKWSGRNDLDVRKFVGFQMHRF